MCYLLLLVLPDVEEEEGPGGEDHSVRLGAGGSRGHQSPVLVPAVVRLRSPVCLAVEGEGLVLWHNLGLGMFGDVRRTILT